MAELERLWTTAWTWLVANATVERSSVVISLIAILIAYRSARHAKRGVRAAEAQATAAAEQVEVARHQLLAAQVDSAERIAEVSALTSYRDFFETYSAKIAVALEPTLFPPEWKKGEHGLSRDAGDGCEYPIFDKKRNLIVFDEGVNEYDDIYFSVRGLICNVGQVAAHVFGDEFQLIAGESPLAEGHMSKPQRLSERGGYLFLPGQQAIFEWRAERYLQQWIEIYKDSHRGDFDELDPDWKSPIRRPVCRFAVWPAGSGMALHTLVKIQIDENVVRPYWSDSLSRDGKWVTRMSARPAAHILCYLRTTGAPAEPGRPATSTKKCGYLDKSSKRLIVSTEMFTLVLRSARVLEPLA